MTLRIVVTGTGTGVGKLCFLPGLPLFSVRITRNRSRPDLKVRVIPRPQHGWEVSRPIGPCRSATAFERPPRPINPLRLTVFALMRLHSMCQTRGSGRL